jgi:hypothetical protein
LDMGKSSLLIWCGNLILQKDLHHVYLILRNLLYLIHGVAAFRIIISKRTQKTKTGQYALSG